MKVDLITMGEMLIDFVPLKKGLSLKENEGFLRMPGGAPANVAAGVAKLGYSTAFFGKVGKDPFGNLLIDTLKENNVETEGVVQTKQAKTTLAFVTLDETGDRDFTFYRDPGADTLYRWDEVNMSLFSNTRFFHHGSISLIEEPGRTTTLKMAEEARNKGIIVSYDPNLRMPLWPDEKEAKHWIIEGLKTANLIKVSEEELEFITGTANLEEGVERIKSYGVDLIFVTLGEKGCYFANENCAKRVPGFQLDVEDTTGAGDAFVSGVISQLLEKNNINLVELSENDLINISRFANATGALTTMNKGAMAALPSLKEVENLLIG